MKFYLSDRGRLFSYFILLGFLGAVALQLPSAYTSGKAVPFIDALFTSVSALCVTGLSTVDMSVYTRFGFCILLILIELGGLGIVTFTSFYLALPTKKVSLVSRRMVRDFFIDDVEANPRKILASILRFTFIIQFAGAILLVFPLKHKGIDEPIFHAVFLSVSAFCNAGFAPYSDNLVSISSSAVCAVVATLIIFGGIGFIVLQNIAQVIARKKTSLSFHTKLVLLITFTLILSGALLLLFTDYNVAFAGMSVREKIRAALFQSVTTRTAGFETVAQKDFSIGGTFVTMILMFIGGSPGSVAGGIKTTTFLVTVLYLFSGNEEKISINIFSRNIDPKTTGKALSILSRSMVLVLLSVFLLTLTESSALLSGKAEFLDVMFESFSAFGTVGLSRGFTSHLTLAGKIVIIFTMFIGRTGIFAMMLHSEERSAKKFIQYPHESVLLG